MIVHYVFVRRDLPLGVLAAMVTHAAGESGALYQDLYNGRFRGATAVVLEAKNERDLTDILDYLTEEQIQHVVVHESEGEYHGQLMAIGLVPTEREFLAPKLEDYQTLKTLTPVASVVAG